jgi:NAD(P)-dependent dehydrogenase (short-subunit alcohol dehydrogenase family)
MYAMRLKGKVSIVTGGAAGIGKGISAAFAAEGAKVAIVNRRASLGEEVAKSIRDQGFEAKAFPADVSKEEQVTKMVEDVVGEWGKIDILVNNAAVIHNCKLVDLKLDDWNRVLTINLTGYMLCCREVAKAMIEQGTGGRIVNLSSIAALISEEGCLSYVCSKGAILSMTKTVAHELVDHGILVNSLLPGATWSELTEPMYTESVQKGLKEKIPMREIGRPEYIAKAALFLASDDSYYMTGQEITMDGGWMMNGRLPGATYWEEE